jgi:hypothetical protein
MKITHALAIAAAPVALAAALLGTAGQTAAAAAPAVLTASVSTAPGSNGQAGQLTGNHATSYTDPVFGPVQCNETQHAKFDTVECQSTTGLPLTNVAPNQAGTVGWNSDFGTNSMRHATGVLAYTVSADGMSYTGQATYPQG